MSPFQSDMTDIELASEIGLHIFETSTAAHDSSMIQDPDNAEMVLILMKLPSLAHLYTERRQRSCLKYSEQKYRVFLPNL